MLSGTAVKFVVAQCHHDDFALTILWDAVNNEHQVEAKMKLETVEGTSNEIPSQIHEFALSFDRLLDGGNVSNSICRQSNIDLIIVMVI